MSLALKPDEKATKGVRRVARKRLAQALRMLEVDHPLDDEAIHEARKHLTEVRSVLRLARHLLGRKSYRRENSALREAGRPLSGLRDAAVLMQTLDQLIARSGGRLSAREAQPLRAHLQRQRLKLRQQLQRGGCTSEVAESLSAVRKRARRWHARHEGWPSLVEGLQRIYCEGRQAMRASRPPQHSNEILHTWRKRAKSLRYALEFLQRRADSLAPVQRQAHQLASLLGRDHDLVVLDELARRCRALQSPATIAALRQCIERRRRQLQRRARALGRRLFSEPSRRLIDRV